MMTSDQIFQWIGVASVVCLSLVGCGALLLWALNLWVRATKTMKVIMDPYRHGYKDGHATGKQDAKFDIQQNTE